MGIPVNWPASPRMLTRREKRGVSAILFKPINLRVDSYLTKQKVSERASE